MELEFLNWRKHQPKKAVHPRWFAFNNDFAYNHNFRNFTNNERLVFIYLLGEASKQNRQGRISIDPPTFSKHTSTRTSIIISTINKLIERKIIVYTTEQDKTSDPPQTPVVDNLVKKVDMINLIRNTIKGVEP